MKKLNKSELILGFCSTILLTFKLSWWGLLLSCITSLLWAVGGSWKKSVRRFGVPVAVFIFTLNTWVLLGVLPLLVGDGYPSTQPPDDGSWIGQQVYKLGLGPWIGGFVTKILIVMLLQIAWIPVWLNF